MISHFASFFEKKPCILLVTFLQYGILVGDLLNETYMYSINPLFLLSKRVARAIHLKIMIIQLQGLPQVLQADAAKTNYREKIKLPFWSKFVNRYRHESKPPPVTEQPPSP